ncbi:MAG: hypothetical protein DJ555_01310 [Desulfurococcaceae archaeon]|nr:MAG: hypothetical protein DJ555_01310 [Desulfurococcaceae archaeon]
MIGVKLISIHGLSLTKEMGVGRWEVRVKSGVKEKQNLVVVKVGGSLVRSPKDYVKVSEILVRDILEKSRAAIVVSAIKGITDLLISICNGDREALDKVIETHRRFSRELGITGPYSDHVGALEEEVVRYSAMCRESMIHRDRVLSIGERFSVIALAKTLSDMGLRVRIAWPWDVGIITDDRFGDASPKVPDIYEDIGASVRKIIDSGYIPVIPGFIGVTKDGYITTMGRGSSDLTAVLIARATMSSKAILLTETPGIMTTDPKIVPGAYTVEVMDFVEGERASRYSVKGLNYKMFEHVWDYDGEIHILDLSMRGTKICRECRREGAKVIAPFAGGISVIGWGSGKVVKTAVGKNPMNGSNIELRDEVETLVLSKADPVELVRIIHKEVFGR